MIIALVVIALWLASAMLFMAVCCGAEKQRRRHDAARTLSASAPVRGGEPDLVPAA